MSTSPFMDDYSSEDYSDHNDDYYIVSAPTLPQHVHGQVEIQTQSNDLQNVIMGQQVDVSESVYFDVLPKLEAQTMEEKGGSMEQSIYLPVESYFDLEAHVEIGVVATGVATVLEAETAVEELVVVSNFNLEAQVETGLLAALDTETVLEEGNVIESESLETVEVDTEVETIESMIKEFMFEAVEESEFDLEVEDAIGEPKLDVDRAANVGPGAQTAIKEGDVMGGSISKGMESDYDLDGVKEDVVEEVADVVKEAADVVEGEDSVEGEDYMVKEEDDFVEEEDVVIEEEHDVIDDALESGNSLEAEALVEEGVAMEESIYEPLDLQAKEPEALVDPTVLIKMTTFKAREPYSDFEPDELEDLSDEQSDCWDDESDLNEEEWDSDAEEEDSDMDSSDFDRTEEDEDEDVVVSYLNSSTPIRNKAWKNLGRVWVKLPVMDIPTLEDSSLLESFLDCGPMLMLQECGNAVMNFIETLLCELSRIRNDLRCVLGALFRYRETTKHA